jgi:survival-of-motor-neuron-related-splicing factor 30
LDGVDPDFNNFEDFSIPDHLRMKRSDTDKVKLQKKKKLKALKYQYKVKQQEIESKVRQNTWLDFTSKGSNQKAGHFATKTNQESIFKSPDTIMGKVGVVGSGKQMTTYEQSKIKMQAKTGGQQSFADFERMNTSSKRPKYE